MPPAPDEPGPGVYRPYHRLIAISVFGASFHVPENNFLLRCFQYLSPETIPFGAFCWNEECQNCRVQFRRAAGERTRVALSCKLIAREGMQIDALAEELRTQLHTLFPRSPAG